MAENPPEDVVVTLEGEVVSIVESNLTVIVLTALKPEPETVTTVVGEPLLGDRVIDGDVVTLNIADAVLAPPVAVTVWLPAVTFGIAKEAEKLPESVVVIVKGVVVTTEPSNLTVMAVLGG